MKQRISKSSLSEFLELLQGEGEAVYCVLHMLYTYEIHAFFGNTQFHDMHCLMYLCITTNFGNIQHFIDI